MSAALAAPRTTRAAGAVAGLVVLAGLWEVLGRTELLGSSWPPLSTVLELFTDTGARELLVRSALATLGSAAAGYAIGGAVAIATGSVGALVPGLRGVLGNVAAGLNALPWIMLGPLLVLVLPRWMAPIAIAALAGFFYVFVATTTGLGTATTVHHELFSSLGATQLQRFRRLQLPAAIPELVDGLRLAAPAALLGAIFGEWFGAERGLGVLLITSMQNYRIDLLWAATLVGVLVSLAAYGALTALRWAAWRRFG